MALFKWGRSNDALSDSFGGDRRGFFLGALITILLIGGIGVIVYLALGGKK